MAKTFAFLPKHQDQLRNWFNGKKRKGRSGFDDFDDFLHWYQEQPKVCHYCGISEVDCQRIVVVGSLKSKRFPQEGLHGRGTSRGMWLEVDRYNPENAEYSRSNAVLCCYFCNNDKSDVFHGDAYKQFVRDRFGYLHALLPKPEQVQALILILVLTFLSFPLLAQSKSIPSNTNKSSSKPKSTSTKHSIDTVGLRSYVMTKYFCDAPPSAAFEDVKFFFGEKFIYRRTRLGVKSYRIVSMNTDAWGSETYFTRAETGELTEIVLTNGIRGKAILTKANGIAIRYLNEN